MGAALVFFEEAAKMDAQQAEKEALKEEAKQADKADKEKKRRQRRKTLTVERHVATLISD